MARKRTKTEIVVFPSTDAATRVRYEFTRLNTACGNVVTQDVVFGYDPATGDRPVMWLVTVHFADYGQYACVTHAAEQVARRLADLAGAVATIGAPEVSA